MPKRGLRNLWVNIFKVLNMGMNKIWMKAVNIILAAAMLLGNAPATWALKEKKTKKSPQITQLEEDLMNSNITYVNSAAEMLDAVKKSYASGVTDEFIKPVVLTENGQPVGRIKRGDSVVFFNFRPDRARQISAALTQDGFEGFKVADLNLHFVGLAEYDKAFGIPTVFPSKEIPNSLGEVFSRMGYSQLRIAETEKYAHVTFFFNGGREEPFSGEERIIIPSPRVATYDLKPEMSAYELTERLVVSVKSGKYDFIVVNFANLDMVGHTGKMDKTQEAVRAVDENVGRVLAAVKEQNGLAIIIADHGNAEEMMDSEGRPHTQHTTDKPVPFIIYDPSGGLNKDNVILRGEGTLADIAPTILEIYGIDIPAEMDGRRLIEEFDQTRALDMKERPLTLMILDGFGLGEENEVNAITATPTPNMDKLFKEYAHTRLLPFGEHVGLPKGIMGNSEVGHRTIGAGRVIWEGLSEINRSISTGEIYNNEVLNQAIEYARETGSAFHLMGMLSDKGVHSDINHVRPLLEMAKRAGIKEVYIHGFMDGRDAPPESGADYLEQLQKIIADAGIGKLVDVEGRYYAMDRDRKWERTKLAYDALVFGSEQKDKVLQREAIDTDTMVANIVNELQAGFANGSIFLLEPDLQKEDIVAMTIDFNNRLVCYHSIDSEHAIRLPESTEDMPSVWNKLFAIIKPHALPMQLITTIFTDELLNKPEAVMEKLRALMKYEPPQSIGDDGYMLPMAGEISPIFGAKEFSKDIKYQPEKELIRLHTPALSEKRYPIIMSYEFLKSLDGAAFLSNVSGILNQGNIKFIVSLNDTAQINGKSVVEMGQDELDDKVANALKEATNNSIDLSGGYIFAVVGRGSEDILAKIRKRFGEDVEDIYVVGAEEYTRQFKDVYRIILDPASIAKRKVISMAKALKLALKLIPINGKIPEDKLKGMDSAFYVDGDDYHVQPTTVSSDRVLNIILNHKAQLALRIKN